MIRNKAILVFPFIILSLLAAIWSGWIRIGWNFPIANVATQHGALMVNSFLASLIFLERSVSFRNRWVLLLPFINALSIVAFAFNLPAIAQLVFIVCSCGFIAMCSYFIYTYKEAYYFIFLAGAICLLAGNIIWYRTNSFPSSVIWWMGFLLFTIVAERLELSRFLKLTSFKRNLLWACLVLFLVAISLPFHLQGNILMAISIAMISLWLLKYDMARHSIKVKGQHRYSGLLLIAGYAWLLIMAVLLLFQNSFAFGYDAVLHSFFIGFIFSMIFSHAVIILPAVTKLSVKLCRPFLYVWFVLLQISLVIRIVADILEDVPCRRIGGMVNGICILLFFISIVVIMKLELNKRKQSEPTAILNKAVTFT